MAVGTGAEKGTGWLEENIVEALFRSIIEPASLTALKTQGSRMSVRDREVCGYPAPTVGPLGS